MAHDNPILEQATAWAVRAGDPSFDDWEGLMEWLERDPAHAAAYDRVSAAVADAAEALPAVSAPANDEDIPVRVNRRTWIGALVATAATAMIAFGVWQANSGPYSIETMPGETRMIALETGGEVELAGGSRITLDRDDPSFAVLEQGQALFTIRHDPSRPFRVEVGEDRLVDIGTVFDVKYSGDRMSVSVSEGAVMFNPGGQNVRVSPGEILSSASGSDAYTLAALPAAEIGEWREGRLTYRGTALGEVAQDLSRATGLSFEVAPSAAARPVSGSILVDPVRDDPRSLGPLLGLEVRPAGDGWRLEAR